MAPAFSCSFPSSMFNQQAINWASLNSEINTHILKSLPTTPPPAVTAPIRRLVSAAPPSIAPALCLSACELVGRTKSQAMNTACAIQLMHAAAHAHTRLLLKQELTIGVELMAGDGLLPLGYEIVGRSDAGDAKKVLRVIKEIARVMGPEGVVEGQLLEVEGGREEWVWERKDGRLSACGAVCGAILGGVSEEGVERMRRFGLYVGMMMSADESGRREVVEVFRSLARLELEAFEEGRVEDAFGFLELGWKGTRGMAL